VCLPPASGSARPVFPGVDPDRPGSGDVDPGLPVSAPGFPGAAGPGPGIVASPGSAAGSACPGVPLLARLVLVLAWLALLVSVAVVLAVPVLAVVALALLEMAPIELEPTSPVPAPLVFPALALVVHPNRGRLRFSQGSGTETGERDFFGADLHGGRPPVPQGEGLRCAPGLLDHGKPRSARYLVGLAATEKGRP